MASIAYPHCTDQPDPSTDETGPMVSNGPSIQGCRPAMRLRLLADEASAQLTEPRLLRTPASVRDVGLQWRRGL